MQSQLSFANLSFEPASGVVQLHTGDLSRPKVSLRVCTSEGTHIFVMGTPEQPLFYDAEAIVRGLAEGGNEFDMPLPAPLPFPAVLAKLDEDELGLILDAAMGMPKLALASRVGSTEALESLMIRVQTQGFAIGKPSSVGPIEVKVRADMAQRKRELAINQRLLAAADSGATLEINDPERGFFVIDRAPEALLRQLAERDEPNYEKRTRMSWNFDKMQQGDRMTLPANLAKRGQTAVHVYAARVGKRFHTTTNRGTGNLTIIRIADRSTTKPTME